MVVKRSADSAESPILEEAGESGSELKPKPLVKYGELVILGYNGFLPAGDRGRRRSKFVLYRRQQPNGVRRSKHYVVKTPHNSKAILDATQHSISYTLSRNQAVIVEYNEDNDTDMFQQDLTSYVLALLTDDEADVAHSETIGVSSSTSAAPLRDLQLFGDCELAVMAAPADVYAKHSELVRAEYDHLTERGYVELRVKVLDQFSKIPKLYHTPEFASLEPAARDNIESELMAMRAEIGE